MVADHGGISAAADEQAMEIDAAPPYISAATATATDGAAVQDEELEEGEIPPAKEHPTVAEEQHVIMGSQVSVSVTLHEPAADCGHEPSVPATDAVQAPPVAAEDFKVVNSPAGSSSCNVSVQSFSSEDPSEHFRGQKGSEIPKMEESSDVAKDYKVVNSSAGSSSCNVPVQSVSSEVPSEEECLKRKRVPEIPKMDQPSDVAKDFKVVNRSAWSSCSVAVQSLSECPSEEEELKGKRVPETPKMDASSGVAARVPGGPAMRRKVMLTARKSVRPPKMIKKSAVDTQQHTPFSKNNEKKSEPASTIDIEDTDEFTKDLVKQALMSSEKRIGTQGKEADTVKGYFGPRKKVKVNDPKSEIGRRVTRNVIKNDSDEFTADVAKQAPMSSEKRPMTQGTEASTVRGYFGPRKVKVKVPANVPIKVNLTCKLGSKDKFGDKVASNLEGDDILKGLAVREGKLEFYLKESTPGPSMKCQRQNADARSKVKMMCRRFEAICRTIAQAVDQRSLKVRRIDIEADKAIKTLPDFTKHGPILGEVPGVQVGDEFLYRVELAIVGLHRPYQGGIDSTKDRNGVLVAISVVASGGYPDERSSSGELVYTGSGGKHAGRNAGGDQKLERGNLALKNCINRKSPVRVIHGFKRQNIEESSHSRAKEITTFTYDGLYHVVDCWREGHPGSEVFKYKLQRIPGQPELPHCRKKWIMS